MKPICLTQEQRTKIFENALAIFEEKLSNFVETLDDTKITIPLTLDTIAKDKVTVLYTPEAYLRMRYLVSEYSTEVGWYGLVERVDEKLFKVYDVKVCKQYVDGGKVDTDDKDTFEFFDKLTDEEAEHMHFQAHSHVNMSTTPSAVDTQNQIDVVKNMGKEGFYIFQIWNKNGDVNTFIYDLDHNVYYDRKDIVLEVEDPVYGTLSSFYDTIDKLVIEKKYTPYKYPVYNGKNGTYRKKENPPESKGYYPKDFYDYDYYHSW